MKAKKSGIKVLLSLLLIGALLFGSASIALATDNTLSEVRSLLQNSYVDPVSDEVLNAATVDEMLNRLGDPHTMYFSAADYQNFINAVDLNFSGIGVRISIVPAGVLINSVITGSPAEKVGLKSGDIITEAAGQVLAGMSSEQAVVLIQGPVGSKVDLRVKRGTDILQFSVTRAKIEDPTVTGEVMNGHIGYVAISSFGSITPVTFAGVVKQLQGQNVDSWIVDLRNNPGGYLNTAIDLAGYFIGPKTAIQVKDRNDPIQTLEAANHGFVLNQPVVFLVNENSASASEILTAAVKDYQKATIIGTNTYGKGTVQSLFSLSDGGVLKMTIARFYSPNGNAINKVGISPDVPVTSEAAKAVAELLLVGHGRVNYPDNRDYIRLTTKENSFDVPLEQIRTPDQWQTWDEILNSVTTPSALHIGGKDTWVDVSAAQLKSRWPLYYPDYQELGGLTGVAVDKKFTLNFLGTMNWQTVNSNSLELINSTTGERVPLAYQSLDGSRIQLTPQKNLQAGTTYWLVVHRSIEDVHGYKLQNGALALVQTAGSGTAQIQRFKGEIKPQNPRLDSRSDYGQAIIDLTQP